MKNVSLGIPVDVAAEVEELLRELPALAPKADELGNLQATFELGFAGSELVAYVPEAVAAATVRDAAAPAVELHAARLAASNTEQANETTLRDRANAALANLEAAWNGWSGLTAAQKDAALKLNVRVTISIARLVLRKLDQA